MKDVHKDLQRNGTGVPLAEILEHDGKETVTGIGHLEMPVWLLKRCATLGKKHLLASGPISKVPRKVTLCSRKRRDVKTTLRRHTNYCILIILTLIEGCL